MPRKKENQISTKTKSTNIKDTKKDKWIWLEPIQWEYWLAKYCNYQPQTTKSGERIKISPNQLAELKEKPLTRRQQYQYLAQHIAHHFKISQGQALDKIWETSQQFEQETEAWVSENLTPRQIWGDTILRLTPTKQLARELTTLLTNQPSQ